MKTCKKQNKSPCSHTESYDFSISFIVAFISRLASNREIQEYYTLIGKFGEEKLHWHEVNCYFPKFQLAA